jgi:hypothetical protein
MRPLVFVASLAANAALALGVPGCSGQSATAPLAPGGLHILFIGNSLTYVNDLPGTLSDLALLSNDTIRTGMVANPDYALEDHVADGHALAAISGGGWQYVVLQQGPSSLEANRQNLISMTEYFDGLIRAAGGRSALYMVWPQISNFDTFQRTVDSYVLAAQAVNGLLLPAGDAWRTAWSKDPSLAFYASDGLHPSGLGTYLAALVMYEDITGKDARLLPPRAVVQGVLLTYPESTIRLLQSAAHETNARYPRSRQDQGAR